jgi:hypothetical protein
MLALAVFFVKVVVFNHVGKSERHTMPAVQHARKLKNQEFVKIPANVSVIWS